jgi:hypothetical protein
MRGPVGEVLSYDRQPLGETTTAGPRTLSPETVSGQPPGDREVPTYAKTLTQR